MRPTRVARRLLAAASLCAAPWPVCASRFLIVRHGETNHNAAGIIQGSSDVSRLTEKGHAQAHALGIALAERSDLRHFDRVFCSPLSRARQTLDGLARSSGLPLPQATVLPELREIDLGSWEARDKVELRAAEPDNYAAWKSAPLDFAIDGGSRKPVVDLWARARVAWDLMRAEDDGGVTLVVSHNACGQALLATALGLDETSFREFGFANCGAAELEWLADGTARWRWRLPEEVADMQWRTGPTVSMYNSMG